MQEPHSRAGAHFNPCKCDVCLTNTRETLRLCRKSRVNFTSGDRLPGHTSTRWKMNASSHRVHVLPGGVSVVGRVVQLVLLFQELWRRSEESGETLSDTEVCIACKYSKTHLKPVAAPPGPMFQFFFVDVFCFLRLL